MKKKNCKRISSKFYFKHLIEGSRVNKLTYIFQQDKVGVYGLLGGVDG